MQRKKTEVLKYIEQGYTIADAIVLASITEEMFNEWMTDDKFSSTVERHDVRLRHQIWETVLVQAERNWQAGRWLLEQRWPEIFLDNGLATKEIPEMQISFVESDNEQIDDQDS